MSLPQRELARWIQAVNAATFEEQQHMSEACYFEEISIGLGRKISASIPQVDVAPCLQEEAEKRIDAFRKELRQCHEDISNSIRCAEAARERIRQARRKIFLYQQHMENERPVDDIEKVGIEYSNHSVSESEGCLPPSADLSDAHSSHSLPSVIRTMQALDDSNDSRGAYLTRDGGRDIVAPSLPGAPVSGSRGSRSSGRLSAFSDGWSMALSRGAGRG